MVRAELGQQLDAVVAADMEVEQHERRLRRELAARLVERRRLEHVVAVELEVDPAEQPDRRLVVDDQDRVSSGHNVGESSAAMIETG